LESLVLSARAFLKTSAIYGAGHLLLQVSGFVLLPIYTRALSPGSYASLEVLNRVCDVMVICLMVPGIRQSVLAFYNQSHDETERQRVVGSAITLVLSVAAVGGCLAIFLAGPLSARISLEGSSLMRLAMLSSALELTVVIPMVVTQARVEAAAFVAITVGQSIVKIGLAIVLVVGLKWGIWGILLASAATSLIFGTALTLRECLRSRPRFDSAMYAELLRFALPFLPSGLCFFLLNFGDRFFLLRYSTPAELGCYSLGYRLAMLVGLFSRTPFQMVWSAQMYETAKQQDAQAIFGKMFTRIMAAYVFAGLAACIFQDELVIALGGWDYADAARFVAPVILAYFFQAAADLMDAGLFVRRRTALKSLISLASASIMLFLYWVLISAYGAIGAAYATLGGFVCHAAITLRATWRVFRVRYETRRLVQIVGVAAVLWILSRGLPIAWWSMFPRLLLWLLWPVLLWVFGVVSDEERGWITQEVERVISRVHSVPGEPAAGKVVQ
jgi:O-antigen/teichoic acid export membrane protein